MIKVKKFSDFFVCMLSLFYISFFFFQAIKSKSYFSWDILRNYFFHCFFPCYFQTSWPHVLQGRRKCTINTVRRTFFGPFTMMALIFDCFLISVLINDLFVSLLLSNISCSNFLRSGQNLILFFVFLILDTEIWYAFEFPS